MSNSALVNYTRISPNKNAPRNHAIDTITIHCMAGQLSVETCGNVFAPTSRQASSNYGIGPDGRVGLYVEEKDRSWCSSNSANDNRAITIEVASDSKAPYAVTAAAYAKLIELVADICRRNGIAKLVWNSNKNSRIKHLAGANMTVHRDFAAKACPGDYLMGKMPEIAEKVNALLGAAPASTPAAAPAPKPSAPAASSAYYPRYNGVTNTSIVSGLAGVGEKDTSFAHRAKIAAANGISGYRGTAAQNLKMLSLLKQGKLKKG